MSPSQYGVACDVAFAQHPCTHRTYDQYWAEGIDLLRRHTESPEGVILAASLPAWQHAYVGTLMAVRKLDAAATGMVHPQRAPALLAALGAAVGRLVELRAAVDAAELAAALAASSRAPVSSSGKQGGAKSKRRPDSGLAAEPGAPLPTVPTLEEAAEQLGYTTAEMEVPVPANLLELGCQVSRHLQQKPCAKSVLLFHRPWFLHRCQYRNMLLAAVVA